MIEKMMGNNLFHEMKKGSEKQRNAYRTIRELGILEDLKAYTPTLCGTFPIGIDVKGSDLDIIMEVHNAEEFEERIKTLYSKQDQFKVKRTIIRGNEVSKANFVFQSFEFELFGQAQPVHKQHAYLHMITEYKVMQKHPAWKQRVIALKKRGYKTEPAFCELLGISGDPYEGLIRYGIKQGYI
ncbi:DUF4269 domain-containing protein [Guptibacillus algicola]|uniref:DUF4269 domain-containing protein n=1 Tax=Guptibacillus algicola TaxID=225844 RepID=UPI001CD5FE29|nr:DUF4269 domain-containing protein [Alkalihalobacillus algicola]MCA0987505.1 DUF4269 domain-containing protein [Alkalihalobacillus algicola]